MLSFHNKDSGSNPKRNRLSERPPEPLIAETGYATLDLLFPLPHASPRLLRLSSPCPLRRFCAHPTSSLWAQRSGSDSDDGAGQWALPRVRGRRDALQVHEGGFASVPCAAAAVPGATPLFSIKDTDMEHNLSSLPFLGHLMCLRSCTLLLLYS